MHILAAGCAYMVFGLWIVLTCVNQFGGAFPDRIRRYDRFRLLPRWTFFAPRPGMNDYHIVARDIGEDGKPCTEWIEISLPSRTALGAFWNPQKRQRKILCDYVRSLSAFVNAHGRDSIVVTVPYIACLQMTLTLVKPSAQARARQFAVASTRGANQDTMSLVFRSVAHPL